MSGVTDFRVGQVQQALGVTPQAATLFLALVDAGGAVRTHNELALAIHAGRFGSAPSASTVRTQVRVLRAALAGRGAAAALQCARGDGYRLATAESGGLSVSFTIDERGVGSFTLHNHAPGGGFVHNSQLEGGGWVRSQSTGPRWGAMQAWLVATEVASAATGVPAAVITARNWRGQRRSKAQSDARALAIGLAVIGGGAERKPLARVTGFDLKAIKACVAAQAEAREADDAADAALEALEAQVLSRLEAAHTREAVADFQPMDDRKESAAAAWRRLLAPMYAAGLNGEGA